MDQCAKYRHWCDYARASRLGLIVTFLTESLGLLVSLFRFVTPFHNDAVTDGTFASVDLMTWTVVERGTYLIAACLLPLRPLMEHRFQSQRSPSSRPEVPLQT